MFLLTSMRAPRSTGVALTISIHRCVIAVPLIVILGSNRTPHTSCISFLHSHLVYMFHAVSCVSVEMYVPTSHAESVSAIISACWAVCAVSVSLSTYSSVSSEITMCSADSIVCRLSSKSFLIILISNIWKLLSASTNPMRIPSKIIFSSSIGKSASRFNCFSVCIAFTASFRINTYSSLRSKNRKSIKSPFRGKATRRYPK